MLVPSSRSIGQAPVLMMSVLATALFPVAAAAEDGGDAEQERNAQIVVTGHRQAGDNPNANPNAPYKVEKSQNDKFTEELRDTPKTVVAIPKEVIEDLGATSFREVVRSTPGVTLGTGEGGNAFGDRIFIRGFEARNDVYVDGIRDPGVTSREIFAVEQIEVIKGPSGNFGGRGTTGGLVSLESKRPDMNGTFTDVSIGLGNARYKRGTIDTNISTAGGRFAVRVNGMYHDGRTPGRDYVEAERYGGAISAAFVATESLKVSLDYYRFRLDGMPDFGHPFDVSTQEPFAVDGNNFYGVIGRDFLQNGADIGTARIEFNPLEVLNFRTVTRIGKTYNRYLVGTPGSVCRVARTPAGICPAGGTSAPPTGIDVGVANYTVAAGGQRRWGDNQYIANMTSATADVKTGSIAHTIVMGGEFSKEKVDTFQLLTDPFVEDAGGNVIAAPTSFVRNLLNPNPVLGLKIPVSVNTALGATRAQVSSLSAFFIDTLKFTPKIWATLGARYDSYDLTYFNPDASALPGLQPQQLGNDVAFWNYQASLTYKPVEAATLYASFATSTNPSGEQLDGNGIAYDGISTQTQNLAPERNKSLEAGVKWEAADGKLLMTAAAFQIVKDNARENIGGNVYELVGRLRSRGLEFGVSGKLFDRLELFGGYTLTDAKITKSAIAANVGRQFANVPRHSANLLATVELAPGFEFGGQVHYQSRIYGGSIAAGSASFPGYTRIDAVARFQPLDWLNARLNVNNVFDKRYYDTIYRSGSPFAYIAPGRSVVLTLTGEF